jgi:hypothetical protein
VVHSTARISVETSFDQLYELLAGDVPHQSNLTLEALSSMLLSLNPNKTAVDEDVLVLPADVSSEMSSNGEIEPASHSQEGHGIVPR